MDIQSSNHNFLYRGFLTDIDQVEYSIYHFSLRLQLTLIILLNHISTLKLKLKSQQKMIWIAGSGLRDLSGWPSPGRETQTKDEERRWTNGRKQKGF